MSGIPFSKTESPTSMSNHLAMATLKVGCEETDLATKPCSPLLSEKEVPLLLDISGDKVSSLGVSLVGIGALSR